jgi:hypothetical protein
MWRRRASINGSRADNWAFSACLVATIAFDAGTSMSSIGDAKEISRATKLPTPLARRKARRKLGHRLDRQPCQPE